MIRFAKDEDLEAIRLIAKITWAQAYEGKFSEDLQDQAFEAIYSEDILKKRIADKKVILAMEEDLIVAYSILLAHESDLEFTAFYVLPNYQRTGIGQMMLESVMASYQDQYSSLSILLQAQNEAGISFFEKFGFYASENQYHEIENIPLKLVVYQKEL